MRFFIVFLIFCGTFSAQAQVSIYKDAQTMVTGVWSNAGVGGASDIQEVTTGSAYEGTKHYKFDYSYNSWWAGSGLNLDNWGNSPARNFSGYTHIRLAYRGMSGAQTLKIQLRNGNEYGNLMTVGPATTTYQVVDIPIISLVVGTNVSVNAIRELDLSIGNTQTGTGTVYFDAIELINAPLGSAASTATWARANSLGDGVNLSNWLEAYWNIPWNAYPQYYKYNPDNIQALKNAGFHSFRLPVTVEQITPTTPPYTINFNQTAFQLVDSMVKWAVDYDFKLIIDNHHGYNLTNANYQTELPRLKSIWGQLATRYGSLDPNRYMFEIFNEPTEDISNENFRIVASEVLQEIRANESMTHSVLVGANGWNSGGALLSFIPLADANIIYTFHNYDPYLFTHQGMSWTSPPNFAARAFPLTGEVAAINDLFADVKVWSDYYNVPVCLGEFGCSTSADATSRCNWMQTLTTAINANGFSSFYWDALSPSDGFGFYSGGIVQQSNVVPCFASALGLYTAPLAVEFDRLQIRCEGNLPVLEWSAFADGFTDAIAVERSEDGLQWEIADRIMATKGHFDYRFEERKTAAAYYRVFTESPDGKRRYSSILKNQCSGNQVLMQLYPNPATDDLRFKVSDSDAYIDGLQLFDVAGRLVRQLDLRQSAMHEGSVWVSDLPKGIYICTIGLSDGRMLQEKVVIDHAE